MGKISISQTTFIQIKFIFNGNNMTLRPLVLTLLTNTTLRPLVLTLLTITTLRRTRGISGRQILVIVVLSLSLIDSEDPILTVHTHRLLSKWIPNDGVIRPIDLADCRLIEDNLRLGQLPSIEIFNLKK